MHTLKEGKQINAKYRLERALASGGMGDIWVAFDQKLRRQVAIKFLRADVAGADHLCARFAREAWAAAQIRSPHVVQTYDCGVYRSVPFIVLELLDGEDLRARLAREGAMPVRVAQRVLVHTLRGLDAAHAAGIVHRDLKPANVFLANVAGQEVGKLVDFGVAGVANPSSWLDATRTGQTLGTPRYMSPEQVMGSGNVDARSDLWSAGLILYVMLTGEHPFSAPDFEGIRKSICNAPIRRPSAIVPSLTPEVDAFVERALERDPARRFQSALEMLDAVEALGVTELTGRRRAVTVIMGTGCRVDEAGVARCPPDEDGTPTALLPPAPPARPEDPDATAPVRHGPARVGTGAPPAIGREPARAALLPAPAPATIAAAMHLDKTPSSIVFASLSAPEREALPDRKAPAPTAQANRAEQGSVALASADKIRVSEPFALVTRKLQAPILPPALRPGRPRRLAGRFPEVPPPRGARSGWLLRGVLALAFLGLMVAAGAAWPVEPALGKLPGQLFPGARTAISLGERVTP